MYSTENIWSAKIDRFISQNSKNLRLDFIPDSNFEGTHVYLDHNNHVFFSKNKETYQTVYKWIKDNFLFMFRFPCTMYFYKSGTTIKFILFSPIGFVAEEKEISTFPETIQQYFQSSIQLESPSDVIFPYIKYLNEEREKGYKEEIYFLREDDELDWYNQSEMDFKARNDLEMIESLVLLLSPYDYGWY